MTSNQPRRNSALRHRVTTGAVLVTLAAAVSVAAADPALADVTSSMQNAKYLGTCLDSNENGDVYALTCNGGPYQNWRYAPTGVPYEFMIINTKTNRCLDNNYAERVFTSWCNESGFQKWYNEGTSEGLHIWKNRATGKSIANAREGGDEHYVHVEYIACRDVMWIIPGLEAGSRY